MAALDILRFFEEDPPAFDYVLPGMLAGSVGFLMSPGGVGKSMLALGAACGIAAGTKEADLYGFEPKQGKVVYMSAEDGEVPLWHRLHNFGKKFGPATRQAIAENLMIFDVVGRKPDIMAPEWVNGLCRAKDARLIIIDTLTRFHTLDENSNSDMSQLVSQLEYISKQTGAAILVIHHSSKSMAVQGRGDEQQAARGASALIDNARWAANLTGMTKAESEALAGAPGGPAVGEDERRFYVRFNISKQNHGVPFPETWLARSEGGVLVRTTLYAVEKKRGNGKNMERRDAV
ncbi:Regulatory protein RepA [Massilia sp. Bi118]|jgi:RecA-family ATPase|uniref:helicase RepA family protein n=1 Tax=Massilia sp. Bi118 TaxID=2822346 RepID=UPI001D9DBC52|nr:helicase RepA family protein [Massilia sp. Bi118]CAH0319030.1 Regulatory protein RepA [Massilia sp. Bi118]